MGIVKKIKALFVKSENQIAIPIGSMWSIPADDYQGVDAKLVMVLGVEKTHDQYGPENVALRVMDMKDNKVMTYSTEPKSFIKMCTHIC